MPVTEFAVLPLKDGIDVTNADLQAGLAKAKTVMESATQRRFYYFHQIEDPAVVYVLGEWTSTEQHWQEFIPSAANQGLLTLLAPQLDTSAIVMYHLDMPQANIPLDKPILSIGRHFVPADKKSAFFDCWKERLPLLEKYTARPGGGWRIEKEGDDKEEFILFTGWESVDEHHAFGKTGDFQQYRQILDHISGAEVRHAKLLDLA